MSTMTWRVLCDVVLAEHSGRRVVRARKVSQRVGQVSAAERENVRNARLDALENDDAGGANAGVTGDSDEEYVLQDSDDGAAERLHANASCKSRPACLLADSWPSGAPVQACIPARTILLP